MALAKNKRPTGRINQRGGTTADGVAADPLASCAPDASASFLHSHHERVCEEHRPEQAVSKQRAGLRLRGNAARVVVGGASKQSRAEHAEQPRPARFNNGASTGSPSTSRNRVSNGSLQPRRAGDIWINETVLFGEHTQCFAAETDFTFDGDDKEARGVEVEVILQPGGNLRTDPLAPANF